MVAESVVTETTNAEATSTATPKVPAISIPALLNPFQWFRPVLPAASAPASEGEAPASAASEGAASEEAASAEVAPLLVAGETPTATSTATAMPTETPTLTPSPTPSPTASPAASPTPTVDAVALSNTGGESGASANQTDTNGRAIPETSTGSDEVTFLVVVQSATLGLALLFFVLWLISRSRHKSQNRTNRA